MKDLKMTENIKWIKPIPKQSLSKMVMENIKESIIAGSLKPGDFLPSETELSQQFQVGKSSIREAIKMLEAMGYIEVCKGNGSRVRTSVDSSIINPLVFQLILNNKNNNSKEELLTFRLTIEIAASTLAIKTSTPSDLEKIQNNIERTKRHHFAGKDTFKDDMEFHYLMYESTHNPYIILVGQTIMTLFKKSLEVSNKDYPNKVISDHEGIFNALKQKDEKQIREVINKSLDSWYNLSLS